MLKVNKILENVFEVANVFNDEDLSQILEKFENCTDWVKLDQNKTTHYSHVFRNDSKFLPDENEAYLAKFWRSERLTNDKFILNKTEQALAKVFKQIFNLDIIEIDLRCHKFTKGDHFRVHMDGYAGGYATTISLNKDWKWDWGGILNILYGSNLEKNLPLLPSWNTMNILNNDVQLSPHFLVPIQPYAQKARYTITCFVKEKKIKKIKSITQDYDCS
jgi:Rps23 Pro-64 3,4-dihydroxylase Tpa1-like proline 4-hydroxylase